MAEFVEVMRHRKRMCDAPGSCAKCPLNAPSLHLLTMCERYMTLKPEEAEKLIMAWAAEHPEPKYPSWNEAWKQLFPKAYLNNSTLFDTVNAPCLQHFLPMPDCKCPDGGCAECLDRPIPADIAEKLGIKPLEVEE